MSDPFADPKALSARLREDCGISSSYASELVTAKRRPSLIMAVKIERMLGIPAAAWLDRTPHASAHSKLEEITGIPAGVFVLGDAA